ncbi:MAG: hypothetical protein HPM95_13245 [Alphaproteobacteria bacterium]|nr:hypothetical protein [Alphaproteobacteria bacterium]
MNHSFIAAPPLGLKGCLARRDVAFVLFDQVQFDQVGIACIDHDQPEALDDRSKKALATGRVDQRDECVQRNSVFLGGFGCPFVEGGLGDRPPERLRNLPGDLRTRCTTFTRFAQPRDTMRAI